MRLLVCVNLMSLSYKMCWTNFHCPGQSYNVQHNPGGWLGVKRNQIIQIIQPKTRFRLNNWSRHSRGWNKISNIRFRLNRNRNQKLVFGFGPVASNLILVENNLPPHNSWYFGESSVQCQYCKIYMQKLPYAEWDHIPNDHLFQNCLKVE